MRIAQEFIFNEVRGLKCGFSPFGKPKLNVHVYFVDGLLIDTGQSRMKKEILNYVKTLPVEQIFITHSHEDHTGNVIPIKDYFDVKAYASDKCRALMKNPPQISIPQKIYWGDRPACLLDKLEGKNIVTNKYDFELIPIPGHAEDMLGLLEKKKGWFFSGDLYVNSYISYFLKSESVLTQIQSIKNVLKLDFEILFCAHNPQLSFGKTKLEKKLKFLESFYADVAALNELNYSPRQIFRQLKLKENWPVRILSNGGLCKMNMVESVIRDEFRA